MKHLHSMSLVITCYNKARFIKDALISCFRQEYEGPLQIIIVDDASTDDSVKIIDDTIAEHGKGLDIEVIKLQQNRGVAGATDAGWAKARHEWILMVDGDDIQHPLRCQHINDVISEHPDVLQISFCMKNIDINGKETNSSSYASGYRYENTPEESVLNTPLLNYQNWFGGLTGPGVRCLGAAFSRKIYDLWGPLCQGTTQNSRFEQDPVLAFRAGLLSYVVGNKQIALYYRSHNENLSNITLQSGYKGIVQYERFQDNYQAFHAESLRCILRDIEKASQDSRLTNWSPDLLQKAKNYFSKELAGCEMRDKWWQCNWFERLRRALYYHNKVHKKDKVWVRLLPFHVFCWLKYLQK